MANVFIIATKKSSQYPNSVSEIEAYGIYTHEKEDGKKVYVTYLKEDFFSGKYDKNNIYFSHNFDTGDQAELYKREITQGYPFLQSKSNETKRDNLLELPDINS